MSTESTVERLQRRRAPRRRAERIGLMAMLVCAMSMPVPALAQTAVVVQGRVFDSGGTTSIQDVVVALDGHGAMLTSPDGTFRFEQVEPGGYTLRVVALGYAPRIQFIVVDGDTTVDVPLQIAPLPIDALLVEARPIDIEGRVRDRGRDLSLVNANVLTNQGRATQTDANGRFSLERVLEGLPLLVTVQAFGYLPVDKILLPSEDESYVFDLEPDTVMERMIEVQVLKLEERAAPRFSGMRPMNRERLLRSAGHSTLRDVLGVEYHTRFDRVRCVVIDEVQMLYGFDVWWNTTLVEEVERVEFLAFGPRAQEVMMRIYTRAFIQDMVARDIRLRRPFYDGSTEYDRAGRPPVCR